MIIVEGPDGAGKTTLVKQLSEYFDLPVAPRAVAQDTTAMVDIRKWTEDNVRLGFQPTIFDRHRLISEPIYGPLKRPQEPEEGFADPVWLTWMMDTFYKARPFIIYCLPPLEAVRANIEHDPNNVAIRDLITPIYSLYTARAAIDTAWSPFEISIWDYTRDGRERDPLRTFDSWKFRIERAKRRAR